MVAHLRMLAAAALLAGASWVQAAPLLMVNYTSIYNGAEPGWTSVTAVTPVVVGSYTVAGGGQAYHSDASPALPYLPNLYIGQLFSSNRYDAGVAIDVTISGFTSGTAYEVTAYSYTADGGVMTVDYYDTNSPATILGTVTWDPAVYPSAANPYSATFQLTADASNTLHLSCKARAAGGIGPRIDGFTVSEVPEPASMGLIALGGLGGLALLRRKH